MPTYEFKCETCESITAEQFPMATRPSKVTCACGGTANYMISIPNVMNVALPDGTKRRGFAELREASRLNRAMAGTSDGESKKEMEKELRKLNVDIKREGPP